VSLPSNWKLLFRVVAYVLAGPLLGMWMLYKGIRHLMKLKVAGKIEVKCPSCRMLVSLVGIWRCHCGFTYRGHLITECPICFSIPRMVRCPRCQVTRKLL
jgi:phage FluMu protein Com